MPETLQLLESVSTVDIPDLLILYLELESSDRGDSSGTSSVISLSFTVKNLIIFWLFTLRAIPECLEST
jgi:hypothetical protein